MTDCRKYDPDGAQSDRPLLFEQRLLDAGLTPEQIASVWRAYDSVCKSCFDSETGCQCWRDD